MGFVFGVDRRDEGLSLLSRTHLAGRARLEWMEPIPGAANSDRARRTVRTCSMARLMGKVMF